MKVAVASEGKMVAGHFGHCEAMNTSIVIVAEGINSFRYYQINN